MKKILTKIQFYHFWISHKLSWAIISRYKANPVNQKYFLLNWEFFKNRGLYYIIGSWATMSLIFQAMALLSGGGGRSSRVAIPFHSDQLRLRFFFGFRAFFHSFCKYFANFRDFFTIKFACVKEKVIEREKLVRISETSKEIKKRWVWQVSFKIFNSFDCSPKIFFARFKIVFSLQVRRSFFFHHSVSSFGSEVLKSLKTSVWIQVFRGYSLG